MRKKSVFGKAWHFLWHSNSLLSWVLNVVLAFVLIKYLLYPGIGIVLGTNLPVVAVISKSMEHPQGDNWLSQSASCENAPCTQEAWYIEKGISSKNFSSFPFVNGFNKGDIIILIGEPPEDIDIGEVIVFDSDKSGRGYPIIHRVVAKRDTDRGIIFETKGDNNPAQIVSGGLNERSIHSSDVIGVGKIRLPFLGFIKIWFTELTGLVR